MTAPAVTVDLIRSPTLTGDVTDVVRTTVHVAGPRREDLVAAWHVVRRHLGDDDAPRTLLGAAVLGYPGRLVEIEAVAALP